MRFQIVWLGAYLALNHSPTLSRSTLRLPYAQRMRASTRVRSPCRNAGRARATSERSFHFMPSLSGLSQMPDLNTKLRPILAPMKILGTVCKSCLLIRASSSPTKITECVQVSVADVIWAIQAPRASDSAFTWHLELELSMFQTSHNRALMTG
jgi:hypothetical protein